MSKGRFHAMVIKKPGGRKLLADLGFGTYEITLNGHTISEGDSLYGRIKDSKFFIWSVKHPRIYSCADCGESASSFSRNAKYCESCRVIRQLAWEQTRKNHG